MVPLRETGGSLTRNYPFPYEKQVVSLLETTGSLTTDRKEDKPIRQAALLKSNLGDFSCSQPSVVERYGKGYGDSWTIDEEGVQSKGRRTQVHRPSFLSIVRLITQQQQSQQQLCQQNQQQHCR